MHPVNHVGFARSCIPAILKDHPGTVRAGHTAGFTVEPDRLPGFNLRSVAAQLAGILQRVAYEAGQLRLLPFKSIDEQLQRVAVNQATTSRFVF